MVIPSYSSVFPPFRVSIIDTPALAHDNSGTICCHCLVEKDQAEVVLRFQ